MQFIKLIKKILSLAVAINALVLINLANAEEEHINIAGKIIIEGNQRIEPETIYSYMMIKEGLIYDAEAINNSLKNLFATGLFADVRIETSGDDLVVKVVENPVINRISFEGNTRIKDDTLAEQTALKSRETYSRAKVQNDLERLMEVYRRSGMFAVTVEPKIIERPQNRVDLVYEINEGAKTYIKKVNFIGNKKITSSELRDVLATKEKRWYRFFTNSSSYDPERLNYDKELLRRYYLKKGYADFRVESSVAELSADRKDFFVTFTITEGERFHFGKLDITTTLPELKSDSLKENVTMTEGEWYNAEKVENTIQKITDSVGAKGYAFVDVSPNTNVDREKRIVDVTFAVNEGAKVYVDRVDIRGNVRTLDKVIRREVQLTEGDAFNTARLRRSNKNIEDLNFFSKVSITPEQSPVANDKVDIKVDVEEKSTGSMSFGIGWSTNNGGMVQTGIKERNLMGKGQELGASVALAQKKTEFDISFTEPYFLDRKLKAGFDLYYITKDLQDQSSYDSKTTGESIRFGWDWGENLSQSVKYTLSQEEIKNVDDDASFYIKEQEGSYLVSYVSQSVFYDRLDSKVDPTEGYYVKFGNDLAGIGGDRRFITTDVGAGKYIPIGEDLTLMLSLDGKVVNGIGQDVKINNRYFLGGNSLRGFEAGGVSARDKVTDDSLGGNWIVYGTTELAFPLGMPSELGVRGRVFSDFGTVGEPDKYNAADVDYASSIRASLGLGLTWKSPLGPINIDFAKAMKKEDFDLTEVFRLNMGTNF
ncbi:MAG: outer membrane protein assembly factor BamA [Alphaproteobacteria bacterium]